MYGGMSKGKGMKKQDMMMGKKSAGMKKPGMSRGQATKAAPKKMTKPSMKRGM